jgi:aspartate racemase
MSWESSLHYYRIINELVRARLGGLHSARILMLSLDFDEIERMQARGDWDRAGELLAGDARHLEEGGADFLILCTNTMHKVADAVTKRIGIPLLHIADPTAQAIRRAGLRRVGLLGTRFTMEEDFYRGRLGAKHGIEVLVPGDAERADVHRIIYDELCRGTVVSKSKERYLEIIRGLAARGCEGIVLGCTEIMMLVGERDVAVPVFDTTTLHASAAVDRALAP